MSNLTTLPNHLDAKTCVCRAIIETGQPMGDDGDPFDVMVLMDAPAHMNCLMEVRIIGIIEAKQVHHRHGPTQDGAQVSEEGDSGKRP